jgi:hypothetical protein
MQAAGWHGLGGRENEIARTESGEHSESSQISALSPPSWAEGLIREARRSPEIGK